MAEDAPKLQLPACAIPVPASLSPEAQAILALGPLDSGGEYPPLGDLDAWRRMVAERDERGTCLDRRDGR